MPDENGNVAHGLPPRLESALTAARAGHHVSFEALEAAVCAYVAELIASGHEDQAIRSLVDTAFQQADTEAHTLRSRWNHELIDDLITRYRDRLA